MKDMALSSYLQVFSLVREYSAFRERDPLDSDFFEPLALERVAYGLVEVIGRLIKTRKHMVPVRDNRRRYDFRHFPPPVCISPLEQDSDLNSIALQLARWEGRGTERAGGLPVNHQF